jgi:hypothetical protein
VVVLTVVPAAVVLSSVPAVTAAATIPKSLERMVFLPGAVVAVCDGF